MAGLFSGDQGEEKEDEKPEPALKAAAQKAPETKSPAPTKPKTKPQRDVDESD